MEKIRITTSWTEQIKLHFSIADDAKYLLVDRQNTYYKFRWFEIEAMIFKTFLLTTYAGGVMQWFSQ